MHVERSHAEFAATRWSIIGDLRSPDPAARSAAQASVFEMYWPPVYAFARRSGQNRDLAAETAQSFFHDVILGRELLESADASRGKLRSLIRVSLRRYIIDGARKQQSRDRAGRAALPRPSRAAIDHEETLLTARADTPDAAFDRRSALAIVHAALGRAAEHFLRSGKQRHWAAFEARVIRPAASMLEPPPLAVIAAELGFSTPADAASAVQVVRKRVKVALQELAADSVDAGETPAGELQTLLDALDA